MSVTPDLPLIKPSDAKSWASCARRVWLENKDVHDRRAIDPFEQLIIDLGQAHERAVLQQLSNDMIVQIASSPEDTSHLMSKRVPAIYQAQLLDEAAAILGRPDFLLLNEYGEYQAIDTKLSLSAKKKEIQAQLGMYRRLLGGDAPAILIGGDGRKSPVGDESNDIAKLFETEMRNLLALEEEPPVRYGHSKCRACAYYTHCRPTFERKGELSLLYGVSGRVASGLEEHGIHKIDELAKADPNEIPDIPYLKGTKKKSRSVLQAKSHLSGEIFTLNPIVVPEGYWIHFDIEDNPLTGHGEKHVYLWGFLKPNYSEDDYEYVWTDHDEKDEIGWRQFLDLIERYSSSHSNLILAHYSSHERNTIRSYAKRYGMEDHSIVSYLLGKDSPLFDLQKSVRNSLVLPLQGYGLKDVCQHRDLVDFQWQEKGSGAQWSVVQFNRYLSESNPDVRARLKKEILSYNRDDVTATRRLAEWLRQAPWLSQTQSIGHAF